MLTRPGVGRTRLDYGDLYGVLICNTNNEWAGMKDSFQATPGPGCDSCIQFNNKDNVDGNRKKSETKQINGMAGRKMAGMSDLFRTNNKLIIIML